MRSRTVGGVILAAAAALLLLIDCTPDLGLAPFFCNNGLPECPEGYRCVSNGAIKVCVKDGASLGRDSTTPRPDLDLRVAGDTTRDGGKPPPQDTFKWPDATTPPPDSTTPPPPDVGPPRDSTVDAPRIGCQSNADCTTSSEPCCCPVFGLPIWGCLPFCLDPFCL